MVKAWREEVVIPTYRAGAPEKAPMFLEKRVYQGSSGVVYPYPVIESVDDVKTPVTYNAIYIENEYIKVMILPELGGRVQMAYDKLARRHFVYYNHVIKPALVGLAGPWISGGIEFNWHQHHRPSTFMPIDSTIENNPDGSVTVWVGERERMSHQKGLAGFTLRPGAARLEISGVVYNPTELPQTFLWWANPAVAVNDHYRSVFPPDINAVFDHGKRAVSSFPIATGTYYKMDYSAGVDISNYKNIKVPTSYMGVNSRYDFEGGYETDTQAGMLHVASHHVSPGKKQWTWGNGDFGRAWDRNLTDSDGPYIELMAGVFTENQPDFTWLMPYEEKRFTQYFFPYRELGIVKCASRDFVMNIEPAREGQALLKVFATEACDARIRVSASGSATPLLDSTVAVSPEDIFSATLHLADTPWQSLCVEIIVGGKCAIRWTPEPDTLRPIPDAAEAALPPVEIKTCDALYLTGLHLEQYRHATFSPVDYYEEALRRDPADTRCNNILGLWYLRRGRFDLAEPYLRVAVREWRRRNPNPYDCEPIYNLAQTLRFTGRTDEAYELFHKAAWDAHWRDAALLHCAMIDMSEGRLDDALENINESLIRNAANHKALALKAEILRLSGNKQEAMAVADHALSLDPLNHGALLTRAIASGADQDRLRFTTIMRDCAHTYNELALDLIDCGDTDALTHLWAIAEEHGAVDPMTFYYKAAALNSGMTDLEKATSVDADGCFPNRREAIGALRYAIDNNKADSRAPYLLGCLFYDARQYDLAFKMWQLATHRGGDNDPYVWRALALALFNKRSDSCGALDAMEKAVELAPGDPRMLMELDQLYKRLTHDPAQRLDRLRAKKELLPMRDDLVLEEATLLNLLGHYREAIGLIDGRKFHPWEGGEGKVVAQYQFGRVELAKQLMADGNSEEARKLLMECLVYPENLGEGKLEGAQDNDFHFLLGLIAAGKGDDIEARRLWTLASEGPSEPAPALYYNDAKPDKIFYQGLALRALGDEDHARARFHRLVDFGSKHIFDKTTLDYFAVSLPDLLVWESDLDTLNLIHCNYMLALGHYGLGNTERAERFLNEVEHLDPIHQGAKALRSLMQLSLI